MRQARTAVVPPRRSKISRQLNPRRIWMTLAVEQREQILGADPRRRPATGEASGREGGDA